MMLSVRKILIILLLLFGKHVQAFQIPIKDSLHVMHLIDTAYSLKEIDYRKATEQAEKAILEARALNSPYLKQASLYTSAMLNWYNGYHQLGLEKCRESIGYSAMLKDTFGLANNSAMMGLIFLYTSDFDSSLHHLNNALTFYTAINDTTQILKSRGFMGLIYDQKADYLNAKSNLLETVLLKRQYRTNNWSVLRLTNSAGISSKYYQESLINAKVSVAQIEKERKPSLDLRNGYHNMGIAYLNLGYSDSALVSLKKSVAVSLQLDADAFWIDYADAFSKLGKYDSAIWCNVNGIKAALENGTRIGLANAYNVLAQSYQAKGNYDLAEEAFRNALKLHSAMQHKNTMANILRYLSDSYSEQSKLSKAIIYADSAANLAKRIGAKSGYLRALNSKYLILAKQKKFKEALAVKNISESLKDEIQKGKILLDLAKLDLYNDVALNKLNISELGKQEKIDQANLKNRNLGIIITSLIALFTVLILVFNFVRNQKLGKVNIKLSKQQKIIESQNRELTLSNNEKALLLGEIHHRVKNNLQTITSLLSMQQRKLSDSESIKVLEDSKNRVMAMGLIHQHLYQNSTFGKIDFKNYTKELVGILVRTNATCAIDVTCSIPNLKIELDNAIYFGLMINELAINSIKHAYSDVKEPQLTITIKEEESKTVLEVKDNGTAKDINFEKSNSFGWKMVNNISEKLGGTIKTDTSNGLCIKIAFDKDLIHVV